MICYVFDEYARTYHPQCHLEWVNWTKRKSNYASQLVAYRLRDGVKEEREGEREK